MFVLAGHIKVTSGDKVYRLNTEDLARAERGADCRIEALDDATFVQAYVPPVAP